MATTGALLALLGTLTFTNTKVRKKIETSPGAGAMGLKRVLLPPVQGDEDPGVVRFAVGPFEDLHWHPREEIVEASHDSRGVGCC